MRLDLQPTLCGTFVQLRPLRRDDWRDLFAIASDPLIWEQHPEKSRCEEPVFRKFFEKAIDEVNHNGGAFAVIDAATQAIIGSTRYHGYDAAASEIEIGWTFLARSHWGGTYNREMKRLMLDHAFKFVKSVVFLVGPHNTRSQIAVERIGGARVGIVEKTEPNGERTQHVKFAIEKHAYIPPR